MLVSSKLTVFIYAEFKGGVEYTYAVELVYCIGSYFEYIPCIPLHSVCPIGHGNGCVSELTYFYL
jgi:hypothetical protein